MLKNLLQRKDRPRIASQEDTHHFLSNLSLSLMQASGAKRSPEILFTIYCTTVFARVT
jgi:hypothetical protein